MMKNIFLFTFAFIASYYSSYATIWYVGPTRTYTLPSQIKDLVQDGDFIYIDGGVYLNDATKWTKKNLYFQGAGTESNPTILRYNGDIPNGKGIFVFETPGTCDDAYIANIVFDGAQVSDADGANGAGIRFQANNLFVASCKFMNCQNGILEGHGSVSTSNVTIMNCEFYNNGYQLPNDPDYSGYAHHIYISASTDTLYVNGCWLHHPRGQANSVKTRAQRSFILYNLIDEEDDGYGSWEVNIAQGGLTVIMGNVIVQGASGANHGIIGYDAVTNAFQDFYFVNNTVINQYAGNIKYFNIAPPSGINTFLIYNNIFASVPGATNTLFTGNIPLVTDTSHYIIASDYLDLGFTDPSLNDYSLTANSTEAINHGTDAGSTNTGFILYPVAMPQTDTSDATARLNIDGIRDIGAYEYYGSTAVVETQDDAIILVYPNPSSGKIKFNVPKQSRIENYNLTIYTLQGMKIFESGQLSPEFPGEIDLTGFPEGIYFANVIFGQAHVMVKIMVQ